MNEQSSSTTEKKRPWAFWLLSSAIVIGLILSILSWLEICVEHCAANQDYLLFGLPFAIIGMLFFTLLLVLHLFSQRFGFLSQGVAWMIAASLGAEIMFIAVQKVQIGHWCPVCLSIAGTVACAALILWTGPIIDFIKRGAFMHMIKKSFSSLTFIVAGFLMAFIGISNPNSAEALTTNMKERLAFGLRNSAIEVYFATDWFCPACKKIEPLVEKMYPKIREKATFYFIDFPVHKKSMNFSPYHLAFLINNKSHYFKARQMLNDLSDQTETPKDDEIQKTAKQRGVSYQGLTFIDIQTGMEFFDKIVDQFHLTSTPTLILTHLKTHQVIKLEGRDEITEKKVMEALEKIGKS